MALVSFPAEVSAVRKRAWLRNGSFEVPRDNYSRVSIAPGAELAQALGRCRHAFIGVGLFSCLINILMLTAPLFMLQIYDRVLPSHSVPTLVGFAVLAAVLFAFQGILDTIRGRVLLRIGSSLDADLSRRVYDLVARLPLKTHGGGDGLQPMRDLDQIRSYLSSTGPAALFDLPWMPLYVAVCFLFHPLIGIAALCGALILVVLTLAAELATRVPAKASVGFVANRNALLEASRRNAEVLHAMGMSAQLSARLTRFITIICRASELPPTAQAYLVHCRELCDSCFNHWCLGLVPIWSSIMKRPLASSLQARSWSRERWLPSNLRSPIGRDLLRHVRHVDALRTSLRSSQSKASRCHCQSRVTL